MNKAETKLMECANVPKPQREGTLCAMKEHAIAFGFWLQGEGRGTQTGRLINNRPFATMEELYYTFNCEYEEKKKKQYFELAVEFIKGRETVSLTQLKKEFCIGDNLAGLLMDELENKKMVGGFEGSRNRRVLIR